VPVWGSQEGCRYGGGPETVTGLWPPALQTSRTPTVSQLETPTCKISSDLLDEVGKASYCTRVLGHGGKKLEKMISEMILTIGRSEQTVSRHGKTSSSRQRPRVDAKHIISPMIRYSESMVEN